MDKILELLGSNPELIVPVVKECINKYKPIAYGLLHEVVDVYKDYSNNEEWFALEAKVKRNYYNALVNAGFTEDQALTLMIHDDIKFMNNLDQISSRLGNVATSAPGSTRK